MFINWQLEVIYACKNPTPSPLNKPRLNICMCARDVFFSHGVFDVRVEITCSAKFFLIDLVDILDPRGFSQRAAHKLLTDVARLNGNIPGDPSIPRHASLKTPNRTHPLHVLTRALHMCAHTHTHTRRPPHARPLTPAHAPTLQHLVLDSIFNGLQCHLDGSERPVTSLPTAVPASGGK